MHLDNKLVMAPLRSLSILCLAYPLLEAKLTDAKGLVIHTKSSPDCSEAGRRK